MLSLAWLCGPPRARAQEAVVSASDQQVMFVDDWSMVSNTLEPDLAFVPWRGGLLRLRYRAYLQGATAAYREAHRSDWRSTGGSTYLTADPRWASRQTHRLSLDLEHSFRWPADRYGWTVFLSLGWYRVHVSNELYETSNALQGTALLAFFL
jgi:hypothetical protein